MSPIRTAPFLENSQTIALESPAVRHLPTISSCGPPQPAMAESQSATRSRKAKEAFTTSVYFVFNINYNANGLAFRGGFISILHLEPTLRGVAQLAQTRLRIP